MRPRRIKFNPAEVDRSAISEALDVLARGGVVAYPTDTVYGLAAPATDRGAQAIMDLKGRPAAKPLLVALLDVPREGGWVDFLSPRVRHVVAVLWPQKISLLLPAGPDVPALLRSSDGQVGLRRAADPVSRALAAGLDGEVITTSANLSGRGDGTDPDRIARDLDFDLLLEMGPLGHDTLPTTLVDPVSKPVRILRQGAVSEERIHQLVGE